MRKVYTTIIKSKVMIIEKYLVFDYLISLECWASDTPAARCILTQDATTALPSVKVRCTDG